MSHLAEGTLRRLVDDPTDGVARAHLAECTACRERFDALAHAAHSVREALHVDGVEPARPAVALAAVRADLLGGPVRRGGLRVWAGAVAACAAIALSFVLTPLRSVADNFLAIFEPQQFVAVPVSRSDMEQLRALPDLSAFGTVRSQRLAGPVHVATVRAAVAAARMPVRLPAVLAPGVLDAPQFTVEAPRSATFTFSAAKARASAAARGRSAPPMPAHLDGSTLYAVVGPIVIATYPDASGHFQTLHRRHGHAFPALLVVQAPAPRISSTGASAREIEAYLLAQPGVPPQLAAEIAAIGDPATTLPIPIPVDRSYATPVTVDGVRGLAVGDETGVGAGVVWQRNGEIFAVAGATTMRAVLAVADSLH